MDQRKMARTLNRIKILLDNPENLPTLYQEFLNDLKMFYQQKGYLTDLQIETVALVYHRQMKKGAG